MRRSVYSVAFLGVFVGACFASEDDSPVGRTEQGLTYPTDGSTDGSDSSTLYTDATVDGFAAPDARADASDATADAADASDATADAADASDATADAADASDAAICVAAAPAVAAPGGPECYCVYGDDADAADNKAFCKVWQAEEGCSDANTTLVAHAPKTGFDTVLAAALVQAPPKGDNVRISNVDHSWATNAAMFNTTITMVLQKLVTLRPATMKIVRFVDKGCGLFAENQDFICSGIASYLNTTLKNITSDFHVTVVGNQSIVEYSSPTPATCEVTKGCGFTNIDWSFASCSNYLKNDDTPTRECSVPMFADAAGKPDDDGDNEDLKCTDSDNDVESLSCCLVTNSPWPGTPVFATEDDCKNKLQPCALFAKGDTLCNQYATNKKFACSGDATKVVVCIEDNTIPGLYFWELAPL